LGVKVNSKAAGWWGLDSRFFFVIGDDRYRLARVFLALAAGPFFRTLDLAINAQKPPPSFCSKLGVAAFQIVPAPCCGFDFLLGEKSCTPYPAPGWREIRVRQPVRLSRAWRASRRNLAHRTLHQVGERFVSVHTRTLHQVGERFVSGQPVALLSRYANACPNLRRR